MIKTDDGEAIRLADCVPSQPRRVNELAKTTYCSYVYDPQEPIRTIRIGERAKVKGHYRLIKYY